MSPTFWEIILIFFLIILNGLFAMSELALISARKVRLQQHAEDGDKRAHAALRLVENPNQLLSTVQIGITLIGVFSGALGGATLTKELQDVLVKAGMLAAYSRELSLVLVVIPITYFSLVIGELIPKRLALANPERTALIMARPMQALSWVMRPIVWLLGRSTDLGVKVSGISSTLEPVVTEEEIRVMLEQGTLSGVLQEVEQNIVESVFRFTDRTVDAIMTSRLDIVWLDVEEPFDELLSEIIESQHTVFPVAHGSLDNVLGILSVKDLLGAVWKGEEIDIRTLLKQPLYAPESMPAPKVLEEVKRSGVPVALVIDEFGGVIGMVTPQDILTAFVGDIPDAGQEMEHPAVQRADGSWLFDGLLRVDELKELLDLDELPEQERLGYQTVNGMLMSMLGMIPEPGQFLDWEGFRFEVVDMDGRRVDKILVTSLNKTPPTTTGKANSASFGSR
ncbi:MAG: HlyC/CorC family transporter [Anaerolineaceae bacterium]|nr:HlyC/CorC family transporter [Anaerolineaceae bacterium]